MMEKLMAALGKSGEGGEGGMDDIASMMANMGGMGGSPEQQQAQKNHADLAAKNAGEVEGGADGKKYKYEQTSKDGESEIIVRFALQTPAAKKDVKVVFKAATLSVAVNGVPGCSTASSTEPSRRTTARGASSRRAPSCR